MPPPRKQTNTWTRKDGSTVTKTYVYDENYQRRDPADRFFAKVDKSESCWDWTGSKTTPGYGNFWDGSRHTGAHRFSWKLHFGEIPEGLLVLHRCDRPLCVNPEHLFLGTPRDNALDMLSKGRHAAQTGTHNPVCGEDVPGVKMTRERVMEMRDLYSVGDVTQRELADPKSLLRTYSRVLSRDLGPESSALSLIQPPFTFD